MKVEKHVDNSVENIRRKHSQEYKIHKDVLEKILFELHTWFDDFDLKKGVDYDYTGVNCIKHREQRHHVEGISEAAEIFSKRYGENFRAIIREEAERHVLDDMGSIYFRDDYKQIGCWKNIRRW